ncbi:MAG: MerR family transcriptional regulator [Thermoleophilia bacterium]
MTAEPPVLFPVGGDEPTLTIGAVCDALRGEHPTISISKIRYLEEQRLVSPKRTAGGYRRFTQSDVERLRTVLRLQRDEFLPLAVIRQELEHGGTGGLSAAAQAKQFKRAQLAEPQPTHRHAVEDVMRDTGAGPELLRDLQAYGLVRGDGGLDETERELVGVAAQLAAYGVEPRHLRLFRTAAEREAGLLEQLLTSGLRSRNPERRREAVDALEALTGLVSHIRHLMLVGELRAVVH